MIKLVIYGEPIAQGRPKFSTQGGFVRAYDPAKSRSYKDYVRIAAVEQIAGQKPLEGALSLAVKVFRPIPKSFSRKKIIEAEQGLIRPITKPDLDNYIKGIKDALKGICWRDDSQVVTMDAEKYYSEIPRVEIFINAY